MHNARAWPPAWRSGVVAAGVVLLLVAGNALALSAGAPRGVPLIGRPLSLSIPLTWDRGDAPPCVRAELQQGESPGGPLRWRVDRTGDGTGVLRLWSVLPVQEPAVTVQLGLGCGQQYAREFVLLAEPPNEVREAQAEPVPELPVALAPLALSSATSLGSPPPAPAAAPVPGAAAAADPAPAAPRTRSEQRSARQASAAAGKPRESAARPKAAADTPARGSGPRLKLEAIDLAIDEAPVLRMSTGLTQLPAAAGTTAPRNMGAGTTAPAASAGGSSAGVSPVLNTPAEPQILQATAALALETELRAMRQLVQRYGADQRLMNERLEKVSGERDLTLRLLAGFLALVAAGFVYLLWLRTREAAARRAWWVQTPAGGAEPVKAPLADAAAADEEAAAPPAPQGTPGVVVKEGVPSAPVTLSPDDSEMIELPDFFELDQSRVPTAEELLGLKDRADFFVAVGQPDKAVHLLESQLHEHTGSSPYVWLDLLDLCRRLDRREDYERLRAAFQKLFSAHLPAFASATPDSAGLEGHPRALSRILLLWGSSRVLKVIEDSLFEAPKPGSITFDLEASRDLLLLYGIASELAAEHDARRAARPQASAPFPTTMLTPMDDFEPEPTGAPVTEPVPLAALDLPALSGLRPDIQIGDTGSGLLAEDFEFDSTPRPIRKSGQFS